MSECVCLCACSCAQGCVFICGCSQVWAPLLGAEGDGLWTGRAWSHAHCVTGLMLALGELVSLRFSSFWLPRVLPVLTLQSLWDLEGGFLLCLSELVSRVCVYVRVC